MKLSKKLNILEMYCLDLEKFERISPQEEKRLIAAISKAQKDNNQQLAIRLRNELVEINLRLALMVGKRFARYLDIRSKSVDELDLIQEANLGLIKAAESFNPKRGFRFSTYAYSVIEGYVKNFVRDRLRFIRVPADCQRMVFRAREASVADNGRTPTLQEISEAMKISKEDAMLLTAIINTRVSSLDTEIADGMKLVNKVASRRLSSSQVLEAKEALSEIFQAMGGLPEEVAKVSTLKEYQIFFHRYGLDGSHQFKDTTEIGRRFRITNERVRQIINEVWKKLKEARLWSGESKLCEFLSQFDKLEGIIAAN